MPEDNPIQPERLQIIFFPYLGMRGVDKIEIGNISVLNFSTRASELFPREDIRNQVTRLLEGYVIAHGETHRKVDNIGVVTVDGQALFDPSLDNAGSGNEAKLILFLAIMARDVLITRGANAGHYLSTSENFQMIIQNFIVGNEYTGESTGYIVQKLSGGYKIGELKAFAPTYLCEPMRFSYNSKVIAYLFRLKKRQKRLYRRILEAAEAMFESYSNNPAVSHNARILSQARAFEVLLALPESGQRRALKDKIDTYTGLPEDKMKRYKFERERGRFDRETRSIKVMWADRFYMLRNKIIHGGPIGIGDVLFLNKQPNIHIALQFFILLIEKITNEVLGRDVFMDEIVWKKYSDSASGQEFEGFVFEDREPYRRILEYFRRNDGSAAN